MTEKGLVGERSLKVRTRFTLNSPQTRYWEANLKDKKPSESNIDGWIRAKYEHKRWALKGPIPDPSTLGGDETQAPVVSNDDYNFHLIAHTLQSLELTQLG